jgi:UDP-N-acetyl-D-mannosaminuronic acid dehydrogenase
LVKDASLVPAADVVAKADVIFVATPHRAYRDLAVPAHKTVIDVWNVLPKAAESPAAAAAKVA